MNNNCNLAGYNYLCLGNLASFSSSPAFCMHLLILIDVLVQNNMLEKGPDHDLSLVRYIQLRFHTMYILHFSQIVQRVNVCTLVLFIIGFYYNYGGTFSTLYNTMTCVKSLLLYSNYLLL